MINCFSSFPYPQHDSSMIDQVGNRRMQKLKNHRSNEYYHHHHHHHDNENDLNDEVLDHPKLSSRSKRKINSKSNNNEQEQSTFAMNPISLPSLLILFGIIGLCISIIYIEKHLNLIENLFDYLELDYDSSMIDSKFNIKNSNKVNVDRRNRRSSKLRKRKHKSRGKSSKIKKKHRRYYKIEDSDDNNEDDVITQINTKMNS